MTAENWYFWLLLGGFVWAVLYLLTSPRGLNWRWWRRRASLQTVPSDAQRPAPTRRYCKHCGRQLRGLMNAPQIPVHVDTESRFCDVGQMFALPVPRPTRCAEWKNK